MQFGRVSLQNERSAKLFGQLRVRVQASQALLALRAARALPRLHAQSARPLRAPDRASAVGSGPAIRRASVYDPRRRRQRHRHRLHQNQERDCVRCLFRF